MWRRSAAAALVAAALGAAWWFTAGAPRLRTYALPAVTVFIPDGPNAITRGRHIAEAVAVCTICHGENYAGKLAFDDAFLGRGYTPNLTAGAGGIGGRYDVTDWVRAIRFGVKPDGHGILFMPSDHYVVMNDADLGSLIGFLRSLPPVDNTDIRLQLGLGARLFIDTGLAGQVVRAAMIDTSTAPWRAPWDEGDYLIAVGGCTFCHGSSLSGGGGPEPNAPPAPALRDRRWTFEVFAAAVRGGQAADGHRIDPKYMPWQGYARMTDEEVAAIMARLR